MAERAANRNYELPPAAPHANEGKTKAGWTLMWTVMLGALITAVGVALYEMWVIILGVVVIVVGIIAGRVMSAMGMGQPQPSSTGRRSGSDDWYGR